MHLLRTGLCGLLLGLGLLLAPSTSQAAAGVRLGLGADYWVDRGALFNLTLGVEAELVGPLSIGGRFGALLLTTPNSVGVPLDLVLRALVANRRVYLEGLVGPWVFFEGDVLRAHAAFGFGFQGRSVSFGLEVGYLSPKPVVGLRLGWRF